MANISSSSTPIDSAKVSKWFSERGMGMRATAMDVGKSANYFYSACHAGAVSTSVLLLMEKLYGLNADDWKPDPEPELPEIVPLKAADAYPGEIEGYDISLKVFPNKVRVGVSYQGQEITGAYAIIKHNTEASLLQAISYAAHMCYKFYEQGDLRR